MLDALFVQVVARSGAQGLQVAVFKQQLAIATVRLDVVYDEAALPGKWVVDRAPVDSATAQAKDAVRVGFHEPIAELLPLVVVATLGS
tara:strand:- start:207 stop:470 length:264 start_codon:yes stop_codon:yes gene_type:complete